MAHRTQAHHMIASRQTVCCLPLVHRWRPRQQQSCELADVVRQLSRVQNCDEMVTISSMLGVVLCLMTIQMTNKLKLNISRGAGGAPLPLPPLCTARHRSLPVASGFGQKCKASMETRSRARLPITWFAKNMV